MAHFHRIPRSCKRSRDLLLIPTADIQSNPAMPRRSFSLEGLLALGKSMDENGLLHPITVTFCDNKPVLVAGERRLRAARLMGMKTIACLVSDRTPSQDALLSLIENLQRENLNCFEEADGISALLSTYSLTQEEAAEQLGLSQSAVSNKLRLLRLPPVLRARITEAGLSERHARALLSLEGDDRRAEVLERIIAGQLTVAETEQLIAGFQQTVPSRRKIMPVVRDMRLFFNTVDHAVAVMRRSGIAAKTERSETDAYFEYIVRIPKGADVPSASQK